MNYFARRGLGMVLLLCSLWAGLAGAVFGQGVPSISANSTNVVEGNAGSATAFFTLTLSSASAQTVTVDFSTAPGTATPGVDYLSASGTASFDPGVTAQTVQVTIYGDTLNEANETFSLVLTNAVEATLGIGEAAGTIQDDDPLPAFTINDISSQEGDTTPIVTSFTVSLSAVSGQDASVWFWTVDGTAAIGSDVFNTSGFLTIPAGETNGTILVLTMPDIVNEADEIFYVNLSNPINATLARTQGVGTVQNDDPSPGLTINDLSVLEGNTGTSVANFTVGISAISGQTVAVNYETAPGTASAGNDYLTSSGVILFPPGTTNQTASVSVLSDTLNEAHETFTVNLSAPVNATVLDGQGIATIFNDDPAPSISINDVTLMEGDIGTTNAVFAVNLSAASGQTVTVNYTTVNGTATAGVDYAAAAGTVTFPPGTTSQTVSVGVNGDLLNESSETFFVTLSGPVNASVARSQGTGSIQDDDAAPTISIDDVTTTEGNFGAVNTVFTVSLSAASGQAVAVNYATANGTATAGGDYGSSAGTLTFAPGVTTQTVSVTVNGDSVYEANETFLVNLSGAVNASILDAQGQGTIVNDDALPAIGISDVTVVEGNSGTTNAVFAVSLSGGSSQTVTMSYATADGTAIAGSDYVSGSGTITFGPGVTSQTVTVVVNGDLLNEINETFGVSLSGAVNATISDGQGAGTIVNDDGQPALSISDVTLAEGNSGTTNASFAVTLSAASGQTVNLSYTTANVTANAGSDYAATSGTLTFTPGVISQSIIVPVTGDLLNEPNESFVVNLAGIVNATAAKSQGTGTIQNDDAAPSISINDVMITEGNSGMVNALFTVSLSAASGQTVTVNFATANGTATAGSDYGSSSGVLTFAPGVMSQSVSDTINGDSLYEANETFFVNLSSAVNATIQDAQGQGTISNDDAYPAISINDVTVMEGNSGTTNAVFTLSLSAGSSQTVTVSYATAGGTAVAGSDYVSGSGVITFGPGVISQALAVVVNGELLNEVNETFYVNLSGAVNATVLDGQGQGTILDDDGQPSLSINDVTVVEGTSGTSNTVFTVSLSAVSGQTVTVNYATVNGTATAGTDFGTASGMLTFAPGVTNRTVTVVVNGDSTYEADETFQVSLSGAVNAGVGRNQALGTIINDDPLPAISINDVALLEGNTGSTNAVFTVTLSRPSAFGVSLSFASADGSAKSGADFYSTVGGLYFSPGITNQSISVAILGETMNEANETFQVNLSSPGSATLSDGQGVGTILNEDPVPVMSIADMLILEGDSGTTNLTFTLTLSSVSGQTVTVDYATQNGSATAPADYAVASGRVIFSPGATSQTLPVTVSGDLLNEADETLFFNLSNPTNASLGSNQAVGTIQNNDPIPGISLADAAVLEGDTGTTGLIFPLALSAPSGRAVSANYYLVDGTATAGTDYVSSSGVINFPSGSTNQTVVVAVKGDILFEPNENFFIRLTNAVNASLVITQAMGAIAENESRTLAYTNTAEVQIPSLKIINPYPTSLSLSGVPGMISKVTVSLLGLWHDSPDDLDLLLVGPAGQKVLIMSDTGGANPIYGGNLTFSDGTSALPDSGQIGSGTFRPTDFAPADSFPSPAPAGPYSTQLGVFAGADPNGTWSLFVYDDTFGFGGVLSNGWAIAVTTTNLICCSGGADADLSVTVTDSPDPALTANPFTYNLVVVNSGPANATGVVVTNTLPPGTTYIGASSSQGTCSYAGGVVTCALGNLPLASSARIAITVSCPSTGTFTNLARVTGIETDLNPANNAATVTTSVILAPPYLSISDVAVLEPNLVTTNAVFNVSLSKATNQTVTVDYTTVSGSAIAGPDFLPTYGSLTFGPGVTNQTITISVSGDSVVEPSETFSVTLTNPANAKISRATGQGTILNDDAAAGLINRFVWEPLPATQYYGIPFAVNIRAVDVNGAVVSGYNGAADLLGLVGAGGTNSILITEVDTSVDRVEFANVTQLPVDISGWEINCYDWLMWPDPKVVLTIPEGTVVPPGSLFICQDGGVYPGAFPSFSLGDNLAWMNDSGTNQVAVMLRNRGGQVVDFMGAVDAYSSEISYPLQITAAEWSGSPVAANPDPTRSYQRIGSVDRNSSADWSVAAISMGVKNAGLTIPFAGPRPILISPARSGNFAAGTWVGNVTVLEIATNMYVRADDRDGHVGSSGQFTVQPTTDLAVSTSASASLIAAGQTITYTSVVTNQGAFGTSSVTFTNKLLGPATYDSAFTTQGMISQSGNVVVASFGSMAVNASARITVTIRGSSPGLLTNTAFVSGSLRDYLTNNNSTIVVSRVNYPPTISAISDVTINEDTATGPISFTVSDLETPATSLVVTAVSSNTNLVPNANVVLGGAGAARTIALTPIPNRSGDTTNTIFVSDGLDTASISFILHVLPVNDPPVLAAIPDRNIPELTLLSFTNSAVDLDQESLTYALGPGAPPGALVNPQTGVFNWTPSEAQGPGTNVISITVRDSAGSSDSHSFTVTVSEVNLPPVLPLQANLAINELTTLRVTNTAVEGDVPANNLAYHLVTPPAGAVISAQGVISWTPTEAQGAGTYKITAVVTDDGSPNTSATNDFTVQVKEVNTAPELPVLPSRTLVELTELSVANIAMDTDLPANGLNYQLLNPPSGASIDPSGTIRWTPSEQQGPGIYTIATLVTDNGTPSLGATNSFVVTVSEANSAPVLAPIGEQSVRKTTLLTFTVQANDSDFPTQTVTYSLDPGAPPGGAINSISGVFTWTPTIAQGPSTNFLTIRATDNGSPSLSDAELIRIVVTDSNLPPVLTAIPPKTVDEGFLLTFTAAANDGDVPAQTLTYSLDPGAPAGASIDAVSGVFTWTPSESAGPSTSYVVVRVVDNGNPPASDSQPVTLIVNEVNRAPTLDPLPDQSVDAGQTLWITNTATDSDLPANALDFGIASGPPGAAITEDGLFSWTPSLAFVGTTNSVTISVVDNGVPPLTDAKSFRIFVNEATELRLEIIIREAGVVVISWNSVPGTVYRLEFKDRVDDLQWQSLEEILAISNQCTATDETRNSQRFYRVKVLR